MTSLLDSKIKQTPMMLQWQECKNSAKDAILFFRLGDFYEAFYDDAIKLSELLDITLTKRHDIPMSGVPVISLEQHLEKLISLNMCVAIAEQVEDPKQVKGIVKREVTRIISPATYIPESSPQYSANNFFASIGEHKSTFGLTLIDISTSELFALEVNEISTLYDEIIKRRPSELLVSSKFAKKHKSFLNSITESIGTRISVENNYTFDFENAIQVVSTHFSTTNLDGYGLKSQIATSCSMGALFAYLSDDRHINLDHIKTITKEDLGDYLQIDHTTLHHLEITHSQMKQSKFTLFGVMDKTQTAMGRRLLKRWITHPLTHIEEITRRQEVVEELISDPVLLSDLKSTLKGIRDLKRLCMKIEAKSINPKEIISYLKSLEAIPLLRALTQSLTSPLFLDIAHSLIDTQEITRVISEAICDEPPAKLGKGDVIKSGYNEGLDELRSLRTGSQDYLLNYQMRLRSELDIKSLKVSYTKAFGYYIEVSKAQAVRMPESFEKRQTLVNNERFISSELKEFEYKILNAQDQIENLEASLYSNLLEVLKSFTTKISAIANGLGTLDALFSFASLAREQRYVRPKVDNSSSLDIVGGRHPIIEKSLLDGSFISNDTHLSETEKMMIITGPNMAGKSTYIRQVALITIMAQMGSFVPATFAHIGVISKVFSRIGASDDLSRGLSTFMVEMSETAAILNQFDEKSLIVLDEIGRGTSTYDGIAIAWAVAKHLITPLKSAPKTLFATHYFELTEMEKILKGVKNYRVAVSETDNEVLFLRKIVQGAADKSYGIHVAKLAGIPMDVIHSARQLLASFEQQKPEIDFANLPEVPIEVEPKKHPVVEEIAKLDLDAMTPMEALNLLHKYNDQCST
ncbi:MAG: DNA mismatch repair protein MutS [Rhabdochlamydiaceae bacterium]|nr:DNA mismatch repair protein MutS [Candidatus Amphrikana amoebophyrae]